MSFDTFTDDLKMLVETKYNFIFECLSKVSNEEIYKGTKSDMRQRLFCRRNEFDDYKLISKVPICEKGEEQQFRHEMERYNIAISRAKNYRCEPKQIYEMCMCGGSFCKSTKQKHLQTQIHKKYLI